MWTYVLILSVLFIIVLILYMIKKKENKPSAGSIIDRNKLEVMLQKELTPKQKLKEEEEKGDFRYRGDYNQKLGQMQNQELVEKEYDAGLKTGISKFKANDLEGAELEFSKIILSGATNAGAYFYRGLIRNKRQDYLNAVNDFDLSFTYGYQDPLIHLQRGIANYHLKFYDKASMDFHAYITINPKNAEAYFNKGLVDVALNQDAEAIHDFTRTIELNPNYETAYYERGKLQLKLDNKEDACKDFQDAYKKGCLPAHHYIKTLCGPEQKS
jgi:tetratricopeptide (TPR) repeat protein